MTELNTFVLSSKTQEVIAVLQDKNPSFLSGFYLSGGTALALYLGHRESEDLDFFSEQSFNPQHLETELRSLGTLDKTQLEEGTVNTFLDGVKLQFLEYPYSLLEPFLRWQHVQLSSVLDIACTKLQTISMRGSKKDFIDFYFLLNSYSLQELLQAAQKKYRNVDYNQTHILKSLVYFEDAEGQPMPRMHKEVKWEDVETKMKEVVKTISFD